MNFVVRTVSDVVYLGLTVAAACFVIALLCSAGPLFTWLERKDVEGRRRPRSAR